MSLLSSISRNAFGFGILTNGNGKNGPLTGLIQVRHKYWKVKGKLPEYSRNLAQRLEQMNAKDPTIYFKVNIGFPIPKPSRSEQLFKRLKHRTEIKKNEDLELAARHRTLKVDTKLVYEEWQKSSAPQHIHDAAQYYDIYNHLFGDAFFYPVVPLDVYFRYPKDPTLVTPVYRGNLIKPSEASDAPEIVYPANDSELYTLALTTPDGHFTQSDSEYLHWLIGNIPGNDIAKGDLLCDYMQPFPLRGVGYCRYVFVLYKQDQKIDFSPYQRKIPNTNLTDRIFSTVDFYGKLQDFMTPAGLAFFESNWDAGVTPFFHEVLDMPEPVMEYDFDPIILPKQVWFPWRKPFNIYLDQHKDPKQLQKELLIEKLKERHPFKPPPPRPKYPLAYHVSNKNPSWLKDDIRRRRELTGKWKYLYE